MDRMAKLRSAFDRLKGVADSVTKTLQEEFEVEDLDEAEEMRDRLQEKVDAKNAEINKTLAEVRSMIEEMEKE